MTTATLTILNKLVALQLQGLDEWDRNFIERVQATLDRGDALTEWQSSQLNVVYRRVFGEQQ